MRYLAPTLGLLLAMAGATGFVCYRMSDEPALREAARSHDAIEWLKADFHLSDEQASTIRRLHAGYSGTCEEHCRRIQEATRLKASLVARNATPAQIAEADRQLQELRSVCETAIARHVREVARVMAPAEGERYLALVLPKIAQFDHLAAPDLHLNPHP